MRPEGPPGSAAGPGLGAGEGVGVGVGLGLGAGLGVGAEEAEAHGQRRLEVGRQAMQGAQEAAKQAAARTPNEHIDRTAVPFVTLDPASSTDLDQAFAIEASGNDLLLHYAIADVAWFVADGDPIDVEAWSRGETFYLPDGKAGLYPRVLAEGAASLLPWVNLKVVGAVVNAQCQATGVSASVADPLVVRGSLKVYV